jgi:hypothetical protein
MLYDDGMIDKIEPGAFKIRVGSNSVRGLETLFTVVQ